MFKIGQTGINDSTIINSVKSDKEVKKKTAIPMVSEKSSEPQEVKEIHDFLRIFFSV